MNKPATALSMILVVGACAKSDDGKPAGRPLPTAGAPEATAPTPVPPPGHGGALPPGHGSIGGEAGGGQLLAQAPDGRKQLGPFALTPPAAWEEKPTTSGMRAAQWRLPGVGGAADAELVVYYFGQGGAGGVEANLDRWLGQFQLADGSPAKSAAKIVESKVAGQKATLVEVAGRYVAAVQPGAAEKHDEADYAMRAAIVESPTGPYYFKLVGPKATVEGHAKAFDELMSKLELAGGAAAPAAAPAAGDKAEGGW